MSQTCSCSCKWVWKKLGEAFKEGCALYTYSQQVYRMPVLSAMYYWRVNEMTFLCQMNSSNVPLVKEACCVGVFFLGAQKGSVGDIFRLETFAYYLVQNILCPTGWHQWYMKVKSRTWGRISCINQLHSCAKDQQGYSNQKWNAGNRE